MSSKGRDRAADRQMWESRYRQMWESVGDISGERMVRRRHGWQHFCLEWPDGTEIGRVKANWNGGTKALTVSGCSYTVKRVGIDRRGGSLTDAAAGRLVGRWREWGIKDKHEGDILVESARQHSDQVPGLLGQEPWIIDETERTLWPGFAFEDGEV
jgi:hypothetical protein